MWQHHKPTRAVPVAGSNVAGNVRRPGLKTACADYNWPEQCRPAAESNNGAYRDDKLTLVHASSCLTCQTELHPVATVSAPWVRASCCMVALNICCVSAVEIAACRRADSTPAIGVMKVVWLCGNVCTFCSHALLRISAASKPASCSSGSVASMHLITDELQLTLASLRSQA